MSAGRGEHQGARGGLVMRRPSEDRQPQDVAPPFRIRAGPRGVTGGSRVFSTLACKGAWLPAREPYSASLGQHAGARAAARRGNLRNWTRPGRAKAEMLPSTQGKAGHPQRSRNSTSTQSHNGKYSRCRARVGPPGGRIPSRWREGSAARRASRAGNPERAPSTQRLPTLPTGARGGPCGCTGLCVAGVLWPPGTADGTGGRAELEGAKPSTAGQAGPPGDVA